MICATGLVTRGYICCDLEDRLQSCDKPVFVSALEVRPKIRSAATEAVLRPKIVKAEEE
jgi:hypothetical protein